MKPAHTTQRPLIDSDYVAWLPLWQGYQAFYQINLSAAVTTKTWQRFLDPAEPMFALGAFEDQRLVGIVHYIFHRSLLLNAAGTRPDPAVSVPSEKLTKPSATLTAEPALDPPLI